jgi:hypothetical protein
MALLWLPVHKFLNVINICSLKPKRMRLEWHQFQTKYRHNRSTGNPSMVIGIDWRMSVNMRRTTNCDRTQATFQYSFLFRFAIYSYRHMLKLYIQNVPIEKANILAGHNVGYSKQKLYMYMCPIPNGFRDRAISLYSTLYTVQTSNTACPHTSCKMHWCSRCNFRKCITLGKLYQRCHLNNKYMY